MERQEADWRRFIRRHWKVFVAFVAACVVGVVGAVLVFLWFVKTAQSTGLVPSTLGLWTMANLVNFILYSIFWEILVVGIPVLVGVVLGWLWWRRLPVEEKSGYQLFGKRSRASRGSGGFSLLFFIAFCLKVYLDGNWDAPVASFTLDYVVGSMVLILEWAAVIFGIPAVIASVWWVTRRVRSEPQQTPVS